MVSECGPLNLGQLCSRRRKRKGIGMPWKDKAMGSTWQGDDGVDAEDGRRVASLASADAPRAASGENSRVSKEFS